MPVGGAAATMTSPEMVGIWLQAILTFAIFSFLLADNPFYKLAEHIFVGISAGYGVVLIWHQAMLPILLFRIFPHLSGGAEVRPDYWVIIPGILGLMILSRFLPRIDWLSRWPIALVVGMTAGTAIPVSVQANFLEQLRGTFQPLAGLHKLLVHTAATSTNLDLILAINGTIVLVGLICTLSYFYFSREHRGVLGVSSRIGIYFLMIAFGAGFGNTVMARISLLIGRVQFLLNNWWPVVKRLFS